MTTFTWRDTLTVSVGEMSRAQGLDCARNFELLARVYPDYEQLLLASDVLFVKYAPSVVKFGPDVLGNGAHKIEIGGEPVTLELPLTEQGFNALPITLCQAWVSAALTSNGWLIEHLKKVISLIPVTNSEPESGNAPLTEPTETRPLMTTIGE